MSHVVSEPPATVNGCGSITLPSGMTAEEAERLVREADEAAARESFKE